MGVGYSYEYVHLKVKRVVKSQSDSEFFVADVQCVDEHGHLLEPLQDVVCNLSGFEGCLEEEFSEEEIAALTALGVSDHPGYEIYNDAEFQLDAVRQLALLPSEPVPPNEQKFALIELVCDGTISVGKVTLYDTEELAIAEGIRRYSSASEDGDEDGDAPVLKLIDRDGHKQWIDNTSGDPVFQVEPVDSAP